MYRWYSGAAVKGSCIQEALTEDAGQCLASLDVLVLHLGRVPAQVPVPRRLSDRARAGQGLKSPGQGACSSQTPAHASQEQAAPQER